MAKKVLLFDADGVLLDSFEFGLKTHQKMAETMGWPVPKREVAAKYWGLDWPAFLSKIWPGLGVSTESFLENWEKHKLPRGRMCQVPGANQTLALLSKSHYLGLITNRQEESLLRRLKEAGIDVSLFQFIQTFDDKLPNKPFKGVFDKVLESIKEKGLGKEDCLYIGDTLYDLEASQKAGIEFVAVLTGPVNKKQFIDEGVEEENILSSIKDLPRFLAAAASGQVRSGLHTYA